MNLFSDVGPFAVVLVAMGSLLVQASIACKFMRQARRERFRGPVAVLSRSYLPWAPMAAVGVVEACLVSWCVLWLRQGGWAAPPPGLCLGSLALGGYHGAFSGVVSQRSAGRMLWDLGRSLQVCFIGWALTQWVEPVPLLGPLTPWNAGIAFVAYVCGCVFMWTGAALDRNRRLLTETSYVLSVVTLFAAGVFPGLLLHAMPADEGWLAIPIVEVLVGTSLLHVLPTARWQGAWSRASTYQRWATRVAFVATVGAIGLSLSTAILRMSLELWAMVLYLSLFAVGWLAYGSLHARRALSMLTRKSCPPQEPYPDPLSDEQRPSPRV